MRWITVLFFAAALCTSAVSRAEPDLLSDLPVIPGGERTDCLLVSPEIAQEYRTVCVQVPNDLANPAQEFYTRFLFEAGWEFDKAEANGFGFKDGDHYLAMMAVPVDRKDRESDVIYYFLVGARPR